MFYECTRNSSAKVTSAEAITQGLSKEGGLFVPQNIPTLSREQLESLVPLSYTERAKRILSLYLTDFSKEQLDSCVEKAYNPDKFKSESVTEISHLYDGTYMLELWHGPTCAFKDMALQLLPHLLTTSAKIVGDDKEIIILVATSGDTGKAALEGFKDVEGTSVVTFYPVDGVSSMQKRQMATQEGNNVTVCAIEGNFDDAQSAVKTIFTNKEFEQELKANGKMLSSANSINWGRLVPQVVYHVSAYCDLVQNEEIAMGDEVNIVVPTGNFGNILSAYYAKLMGVPYDKLICASNKNCVLTDFINTGVYDKNREFKATISPSMDILISSNLERLLYNLCGKNSDEIVNLYNDLVQKGRYEVSEKVKSAISENFYGGYCDDDQTKATIKRIFDKYSYLCDTHTAVAVKVYEDYKKATGDIKKTLIDSTASPYKFAQSVLSSVSDSEVSDEYAQMELLEQISSLPIPTALANLKNSTVRFSDCVSKQSILEYVKKITL